MNVGTIIVTVHLIVFFGLIWRDIHYGIIESAVTAPEDEDVTPFSIILGDFFWEFFAVLYVLIIIAFAISVPVSAVNKYFRNKYEEK